MRELKIYLSDQLNERFRRVAMEAFGYGRGSISKAAEEAFLQWCDKKSLSKTDNHDDSPSLGGKDGSATVSADSSITEDTRKQDALPGS